MVVLFAEDSILGVQLKVEIFFFLFFEQNTKSPTLVDNPQHSDFARLKSALLRYKSYYNHINYTNQLIIPLISSHLQDLKEITHDFLYENYRTEKLSRTVQGDE